MKRISGTLLAAALLVCSCSVTEQESQPVSREDTAIVSKTFVPGRAEIKFTPQMGEMVESNGDEASVVTKSPGLNSLMKEFGVTSIKRLFPDAGEYEERTRREGLHLWYVIEYDQNANPTKAQQSFEGFEGIEIFEPERVVRVDSAPVFNDPKLPVQWHYYNYNQTGQGFKNGCDVNVVPVWKYYTTGDPSVIVGVTDAGIDYLHEDLADHYVGGYNFVNDIPEIHPGFHGTHVAGTISAINNNGIGVSGLAGGDYAKGHKGVSLLSCQIFSGDDEEKGLGSGASAIKWAADHGAVISQNSWGYEYDNVEDAQADDIPAGLKAAIDYFIKYAGCDNEGNQLSNSPMKGGVVIFSAGNDNWQYDPICEYEPVIAVGAVGGDFNRAAYSNYGDWVDICAPGGDAEKGPQVLSTSPGNKYEYAQGTSMACPHVSGVAALVVSYCGGPGYTNEDLVNQLIGGANSTAVKPGQKIGPLVDALGAITYGQNNPPATVSSFSTTSISNSIKLDWTVTADAKGVGAYGYKVFAAKDKSLLEKIDYNARTIDGVSMVSVSVGDLQVGDAISATIKNLDFDETYYVAVVGYSYNGSYSSLSKVKTVKTKDNNPPQIIFKEGTTFTVRAHETLSIPVNISDPDNHSITIKFTPGSDAVTFEQAQDEEYTHVLTIAGPKVESGEYTFEIEVTDSYGLVTVLKQQYSILKNQKPQKKKEIDNILIFDLGKKVYMDLNEYFTDPDGEVLSYSISVSDKSVANLHPVGNQVTVTSMNFGLVDVTVTASDARGEKVAAKFQILVKDSSKPVELSSTTVTDQLVIRTGEVRQTNIVISGQTGKVVYDVTDQFGAFSPAIVDMSGIAPGIYKLKVTIGNEVYEFRIMKI